MQISRRLFLAGSAALGLAPARLWAGNSITADGWQLDTLSDGFLQLPPSFFGTADNTETAAVLAAFGHDISQPIPAPCNVTLYRDGTNTILFDIGAGPDFMPSAGKIAEALDALGVSYDDVTHVVFTHAHPDHLWGVLDDFDEPICPNARYMIGQGEWDFWTDPGAADVLGPERASFAAGAKRRLDLLQDVIETFDDADEILPGITAVLTPGHTLAHMAFRLGSGANSVMVLGDSLHNGHLTFAAPQIPSAADQDPEMAAATRQKLLAELAASQGLIVGFHLPDGGIGRVAADGAAYRFLPEGG